MREGLSRTGRQAASLGRDALNAVAGLPLMAGDFGVALGNLANRAVGNSQLELLDPVTAERDRDSLER